MEKLYIIKIGGNIIDDEKKLTCFLEDFSSIIGRKILVHGGGKLATRVAEAMNIPQQMKEGRRITDAETLKVVTMVYAGYINKTIVSLLQAKGCNAFGLCGADANVVRAHKRIHPEIDYGFVGDVDEVKANFVNSLLQQDITLVFSPITHDGAGLLLNTNADTIAQELAKAMSSLYDVSLIYCFEKNGVLADTSNNESVIASITAASYAALKSNNIISDGMIPKLQNAFAALSAGVKVVTIGHADNLGQLLRQESGTTITNE